MAHASGILRQNVQFGQNFSLRVMRGVSCLFAGADRGRTIAGRGAAMAVHTSAQSPH